MIIIATAMTSNANGEVIMYADTITKNVCLLYTSPSPRDRTRSRMPSSAWKKKKIKKKKKKEKKKKKKKKFFFFFNDTATTEIYTRSIVGSVRCV